MENHQKGPTRDSAEPDSLANSTPGPAASRIVEQMEILTMAVSPSTHSVASWTSPQVVSVGITGLLVIASLVGVGVHIITHLDRKIDEVSRDLHGKITLLDGKIDRVRQELSGQIQHINTRIDSLITQPSRQ